MVLLASAANDSKAEVSRLYHAVLRKYLRQGPSSDLEPAVALGLETLDTARIHEIALVVLVLPSYSLNISNALMGRAGLFFAEAITSIENTHRGAREANAHRSRTVEDLSGSR